MTHYCAISPNPRRKTAFIFRYTFTSTLKDMYAALYPAYMICSWKWGSLPVQNIFSDLI